MKALNFISWVFKKFPSLVIANIALIIIVNAFSAGSLLAISPIVDLFIHPDLQGISPLTSKAIEIVKFFGMPVTLGSWLSVFVIFIFLSGIFRIVTTYLMLKTKYSVLRDIMLGTFEDFFNARWYFFSSGKHGVLLNTFIREVTIVGDAFGSISTFFATALRTILYLAIPFYVSWQVSSISVGIAFLFALPFVLLGKLNYRLGALNTSTSNHMTSIIHENLNLAKLVTGFGKQQKSIDNFKAAFDAHRDATLKSQIVKLGTPILYNPFGAVTIVIALFAARHFEVPLSEMMVLLLGLFQVANSIGNLAEQKNSLENFLPSYEQINSLRKRAKELKQISGPRKFTGFDRELLIDGLHFAYPHHKSVLIDINMRIPKGKMVAFVGESGAGKSTLIDMIMGFHQPAKGRIALDGIPLEEFDIHSYRQKIGYVPQDSVLFNMSIQDNLLWAHESAAKEEVMDACHLANADEFIERLSERYDTIVGERGVRLSGGQVQRIALARAILRKPQLLILDEATSSLDTYSERLIQQAIENIARKTTVIVIAHRLSTIVNADHVYVLKDGKIVEDGTYGELVQKNGYFNNMVRLQLLEPSKDRLRHE